MTSQLGAAGGMPQRKLPVPTLTPPSSFFISAAFKRRPMFAICLFMFIAAFSEKAIKSMLKNKKAYYVPWPFLMGDTFGIPSSYPAQLSESALRCCASFIMLNHLSGKEGCKRSFLLGAIKSGHTVWIANNAPFMPQCV
jgi:hypothetical protein